MSAREYAKNLFSQWSDDDFCNQPVFDKLFFQVINGQRTVNTAGVFPINFTRWRKAMRDGDTEPTDDDLRVALARMEQRRYIYIDEDKGEGIIRSRIRRDELDKQPTVLLSALRIMAAFDSPKFAHVILGELGRITLPVIVATTDKANALRNNLTRAWDDAHVHLETLSEGYAQPSQLDPLETLSGPSDDQGECSQLETLSRPSREGPVSGSGSVSVSGSSSVDGYFREGRPRDAQPAPTDGASSSNEPPRNCPKHPDGTNDNCGPCGNFRRAHERWEKRDRQRRAQAASDAARQDAELKAQAIANCDLCRDNDGYLPNQVVCDHVDRAATNAAGIAKVREAIKRPVSDDEHQEAANA